MAEYGKLDMWIRRRPSAPRASPVPRVTHREYEAVYLRLSWGMSIVTSILAR